MRAYYSNQVSNFLKAPDDEILGQLLINHVFSNDQEQKRAWAEQIQVLKFALNNFSEGAIYFEFSIPRMGKRADNILILNGFIYILEFKVYSKTYDSFAVEQAVDYALDLKNFHQGSHDKTIIPILVATEAPDVDNEINFDSDGIANCIKANKNNLGHIIGQISQLHAHIQFDTNEWINSPYKPTPTIVEAAQALYSNHSVEDITRNDAGAINLSRTTKAIEEIIKHSKSNNQKSICFVTGVPGAGKTLAGLNIATQSMNYEKDEHAVFLSGNGPLVKVLREALIRDKAKKDNLSKKKVEHQVHAFIQNIHHFRDEYFQDNNTPVEKIIIFDEAQRAWDKEQASKFMNKKNKAKDFDYSEPEFLINVMNRHKDWCVIICLIGNGQEINTGEAGLPEWFRCLEERFSDWNIYCSPEMSSHNSPKINHNEDLHLSVCVRSFRSELVAEFIHNVVENNPNKANTIYEKINQDYPIFLTRDLNEAKSWIKQHTKGTQRAGILASSNGIRLRPEGIHVKSDVDCVNWFLNPKEDVRSSCYLEETATEFEVQGLELDWAIVCWDANYRRENDNWAHYSFKGTKWQNINKDEDKTHLKNAYRVLLTRARQGMIIFVPKGSDEDKTRSPEFYDAIYEYLKNCGITEINTIPSDSFNVYRQCLF